VITWNGRPSAVLIPAAELEAIEETLEALQDEDTLQAIREKAAARA
jgi:PHD/YefM family antitoxin component YafN of YafNO toxin-antitoxin module